MCAPIGPALVTARGSREGKISRIRHQSRQPAFEDMSTVDVVERLGIADFDPSFEPGRIDLPKNRSITDEFRDIGDLHAQMLPDRRQREFDFLRRTPFGGANYSFKHVFLSETAPTPLRPDG